MGQYESFIEATRLTEKLIKESFPIKGRLHTIEASNLAWSGIGRDIARDLKTQKKYKLEDRSLVASLTGDVRILDNKTGKVLDSRNKHTLLQIPHITERGSYILQGTERQVINQLRWRPGIYASFTPDNNVKVVLNTSAAGTYQVMLDRESLVMTFRVGTTTNFPIYSVLTAVGLNDVEIKSLLGQRIYDINRAKAKPDMDVGKLLKKLRPYAEAGTVEEKTKLVKEFLESKPLDPEVNKVTVGQAISFIGRDALTAAVKKAIDLGNGRVEEDDVESLAFKALLSFEDFIAERLITALPTIKKQVANLVDRKPQILVALPPSTFTNVIETFFTKSEFTRHADQNNPIDIAAVNSLVTTMGEGGIQSSHAVTDELRTIHPSHLGLLDLMHTPEGQKIGVTNHLSLGARRIGTSLALSVYDAKTGKKVEKTIQEIVNKVIAFPDQYDKLGSGVPVPRTPEVKVRVGNAYKTVKASQVEYIFSSPDAFFSTTTTAIPFLPNNHANRVLMGDKHIEQSVPLAEPDKPLVMHKITSSDASGNQVGGYEELFGKAFLVKAPISGKVTKITNDTISIKPAKGRAVDVAIHHHYPLNSGAFLHDTPKVKVGDSVKENQILVENNFTKDTTLAMGKNLLAGYVAYKGYNFEDGIVISETAAKKLTSVHKNEARVDIDKNTKVGADAYFAAFPQELKYIRERKTRYDDAGIIKKGVTVEPGDILIPAFQQVPLHAEFDFKRLGKRLGDRAVDISARWDSLVPGEVVDVVRTGSFVKVYVKSVEPMKIGDKLSMRAGAKGIVTHILPDSEMYRTKDGKVLDILLNPAGIPSRVNTGQMYEAATGKIALKTGTPYYTENFNSRASSMLAKVKQDMAAAGVQDEEEIIDPKTGKAVSTTLVGPIHFYKLKHQVDTKFKARSTVDESYSLDQAPAKTDESSAQRIGMLDTFSLLSGNATAFLNDSFGLKSQKNDEYWIALQKGQMPPPPKVPFITEKFVTMLLGAGINLRQSGTKFVAAPLTDREILAMSHGEIEKPLALKSNNLMPEKGGLFDPIKTGGIDGNRFNHIALATPIPNPLMLKAIASVARLPKAESLNEIINGTIAVTEDGKLTKELDKGAVGGPGVVNLLKNIDVKKELTRTLAETKTAKKDQLDKAYKRLKYLRALDQLSLTPEEAYVNKYVPIIPTKFRHIQPRMDGSLNVSSPNFGYREIILINNQLKKLQSAGIDQVNLRKLNSDLFKAVSGLTGATAPLTRANEVSGFIEKIKGPSPKMGLFQSKVLTRAQDLSARSTVIPNPKFGLDEIGIPTDMAFTIYKPFVVRRLSQMGYDPLTARRLVETKDELALKVLEMESRERPAIMNRAPSLHKFNLQAFRPRLTDGRAVEVNPLIVAGFNMDFDGDTAGIHVPVSEDARKEALEKLLPSKNLLSVRDGSAMHAPTKETAYGVYLMSAPKGDPIPFKNKEAVLQAHLENKIKVNTAVSVGGVTTCAGQYLIDSLFPKELKPGLQPMTAGRMNEMLTSVARTLKSEEAASIITKLKDLGNHYVTEIGFTVSLRDLEVDSSKRDAILSKAKKAVSSIGFSAAAGNAAKEISALVKSTTDNRFVDAAITSGALGKGGTLAQMIATPVAVEDHKGNPVPMFIERSYAEGHDLGSYIATTPGARKGLIDKGLSVGETGYFNKQVVNSAIEYTIKEADCKSGVGTTMPLTSQEIYDRFIASGPYRNRLVSPEFARQLIAKGKKTVVVRSPITCQTVGGVCQKCFGLDETGKLPPIGLHIGALAGQTLGERATQITLKAFHSGGSVGGPKLGFERIQELVNLPQNVKNKATLSSVSGTVTKIEDSPAGGWFVFVKTTKHYVPKELGLGVKVRQVVKAGDKLSLTGSVKPQELLEYTGSLNTVRNFLVDELARNYSREQGAYVNRKIIETVVRPLTDKAKITDAGGALERFGVVPGDILSVNAVKDYNRQLRTSKKPEIKFEPTLVGIKTAPLLGQDFVGALAHERLKETLMKAPALALSTDTEKGHPVARLALKNLKQIATGK